MTKNKDDLGVEKTFERESINCLLRFMVESLRKLPLSFPRVDQYILPYSISPYGPTPACTT